MFRTGWGLGVIAVIAVSSCLRTPCEADATLAANAGDSMVGVVGREVVLNGSDTISGKTTSLSFRWTLVKVPPGSRAMLKSATSVNPSFVPDVAGLYRAQLVVDDGCIEALPSRVDIAVSEGNGGGGGGGGSGGGSGGGGTGAGGGGKPGGGAAGGGAGGGTTGTGGGTTSTQWSSSTALPFRVVDAEFSRVLDAVIAVSENPNRLHIVPAKGGTIRSVALSTAPTCVSVGPDGHEAAVGHNAWVTHVDLDAATQLAVWPVTTDVLDIVLAGNGHAYAFPQQDQWEKIYGINLTTGAQSMSSGYSIYAGTVAKLHPSGTAMYGADNGLSPSDIEKYSISAGTPAVLYDSPYHGDYAMCGDLWIAEDGARIFTRCGNVFRSSTVQSQDMLYGGSLPGVTWVKWVDDSTAASQLAVIEGVRSWGWDSDGGEDLSVKIVERNFLNPVRTDALPIFPGTSRPAHGRFVFWDATGAHYYVLAQADATSGLALDWALFQR